MVKLSDQQQAIIDAVGSDSEDVEIDARAGCGKTTTIIAAAEVAMQVSDGDVAILAFNKSIEKEMKARAPHGAEVRTFHGFGNKILRDHFGAVELDNDKSYELIDILVPNEFEAKKVGYPISKLVSLCKNTLSDTDDESLQDLADTYDVDLDGLRPGTIFELVRRVLEMSIPEQTAEQIKIDFDDMVWLPVTLDYLHIPSFKWVFVDEAQDMGTPQHKLIIAAARDGHVCYAGDPHQAIYGFRGADEKSMSNLRATLRDMGRDVVQLPLTKTRRCPKSVVKVANQWVPDIEALPEAPEGEVRYLARTNFDAQPGDMVISRLNAPIIRAAYQLLKEGKRARIRGRDFGATIVKLITNFRAQTMEQLEERLRNYNARETGRIQRNYAKKPSKLKGHLDSLRDKVEVVQTLMEQYDSPAELIIACRNIFTDEGGAAGVVLCSTVHGAKGLEAENVWILETGFRGSGSQEPNIKYVAATRSKKQLTYVQWEE